MKPMNANELLAGLALARPVPITAVVTDSRKVQPGELFLALRGERVDGHEYIPAAKEKGAVAALVSQESGELPCIVVENTLRAYGEIARRYREMFSFKVIGITGSVGKTTTKEMIASVLARDFKLFKSAGNHNNDIGLPMTILDTPEDTELLEDVIIENKQAIEMANIYSGILSSMMGTFASVISNNLNIVMKVLAVITIVMSIPTIVFSAYGMNLSAAGMPFSRTPWGFLIVIILSVVASIIAAIFLSRKKFF